MRAAIALLTASLMTDRQLPDHPASIDARDAGIAALGDVLTAGNITGSHVAIGRGASVIVNEAQSRIREIRLEEQYLSELIAGSIARRLNQYEQLTHKTTLAPTANPYRALQSFDVEDAPLFFGRRADINGLFELLTNPITILRSASGAGKSSLLKAGIASRLLAAGHLPVYVRPFRAGPADAIKAWFLFGVDDHPELERARRESATAFLQRVLDLLPDPRQLIVILVDQFEEFFYYLPEAEQRRFIDELERCSTRLGRRVRWVFAIRDDRFTELGAFCPPICLSFSQTYHLTWTAAQARETVVEPARQAGLAIDDGLPPRIIDDLTVGERQLTPLHLQLICHTLYETSAGLPLSIDSYHALGAAQGILQSWLQRVLDGLPKEDERAAARFVLRELVDSQFHRIRREREELAASCAREPALSRIDLGHVLGYLEANGLARREGDGDAAEYELTHDFLAERIELDPETKSRKLASEMLEHDVMVWAGNNQDEALLIPQGRLLFIESYLDRADVDAGALDILERSHRRAEEQSREEIRRLKAIGNRNLAILAIVSVVALTLAVRYLIIPNFMRLSAANGQFTELVAIDELNNVRFEAYEVTNERFAKCVDWGVCDLPGAFHLVRPDPADNPLWFTDPKWLAARHKPVVEVDAVNAMRFCEWIGRTLPTAEQVARVYPPRKEWPRFPADTALLCLEEPCDSPTPVNERTIPQYQNTDGAGIFDLVGSVNEWTRTEITSFESPRQCVDLARFEEVVSIVILGNDYATYIEEAGISYQNTGEAYSSIDVRFEKFGFRCVEDPQPSYQTYACPDLR